jgi:hypothetical protein
MVCELLEGHALVAVQFQTTGDEVYTICGKALWK